VPPYRRPVNMMFQSYALFPHLTVEGNIAFGLKQDRLGREEIAQRVREMLALVKLEGFGARKPHQLSGGQRQRVALARALAKHPKVLLLDEPLAALDRKLREQTRFELMDLQDRLGLTFVIVTHDREEAMTVADRIAVMDRGQVVQVATPAEIYERPRSRFIADFIGDVNLFEGRLGISPAGNKRMEMADGSRIAISSAEAAAGELAWLAVRPERIRLAGERPVGGEDNIFAGEVIDIAYLGELSIYRVRLENGLVVKASIASHTPHREGSFSWHDRVWVSWPASAGIVLKS
jgi:putrescine transport system ATP-binding protein